MPGNYFPKIEGSAAAKILEQDGSDWKLSDVATFKKEAFEYNKEYKKEEPEEEPMPGKIYHEDRALPADFVLGLS